MTWPIPPMVNPDLTTVSKPFVRKLGTPDVLLVMHDLATPPQPRAAWMLLFALASVCMQARPARADASQGFTVAANPAHAAYHIPGAPDVIVHAPAGFDAHVKLHLVVYVHGFSGCVSVLMGHGPSRCKPKSPEQPGWDLGARHDDAHTNTLFIVPQLAFMKNSGRAGAFAKPGVFRAFLEELLHDTLAPLLGGARTLEDVADITLVAHSAGYEATLAILERGGVTELVRAVILMDALYAGTERYARFVEAHAAQGLRFVALHLGHGPTYQHDKQLHRRLLRKLGRDAVAWAEPSTLDAALASHAIVVSSGIPPHRQVPEHHLAQVLRALGLPPRAATQ